MTKQGRALRSLARAILRGADDADDIVQEAYARALASGSPVAHRDGWLWRIVQNLARRRLRDRARRQRHDAAQPVPPSAPPTDELLAQVELHRQLADAVAALREPLRRAVVMRFWHDLPPRVIARRLGLPVATVKTHLQRGVAELRAQLERRDPAGRRWLLALVPIAEPRLLATAGTGTPTTTMLGVGLWIMASKHLVAAAAALLGVSLLTWTVWPPPSTVGVAPTLPAAIEISSSEVPGATASEQARGGADAAPSVSTAREVVAYAATDIEAAAYTVVGRVVTGIRDEPVRDGTVQLIRRFTDVQASARCDPEGRFELRWPMQTVAFSHVIASAPGLAPIQVMAQDIRGRQQTADRIDLGTLRLERGVEVVGRVLDANGRTLTAPARLLLWDPAAVGFAPALLEARSVGHTEPDGTFRLAERLAPSSRGRWILAAVCDSGIGSTSIDCAPGQQHLEALDLRLLRGGTITVRVVDENGSPLAGARVVATPYFLPLGVASDRQPPEGLTGMAPFPETRSLFLRTTNEHGEATFKHLPRHDDPGAREANHGQRRAPSAILCATANDFIPDGTTAEPAADGSSFVQITLRRQRTFALRGRVLTPSGEPVAGVGVQLTWPADSTTSDTEGHYRLPPHGFSSRTAWLVVEGASIPRTQVRVPLPAEGDVVEHDLVVEPRAPVTGRVVDQFGNPVRGAKIGLGFEGGMFWPSVPEQTGADGAFAFADALPSHDFFYIEVPKPHAQWQRIAQRRLERRTDATILLTRLDIRLVDLDITVLDAATGSPISPTVAQLWPVHDDMTVDEPELAFGRIRFAQLPPGDYELVVRGPEGRRAQRGLTVAPDEPRCETTLELWQPASITCRVDWTGLGAEAAAQLGNVLVVIDSQHEDSFAVDERGDSMHLTPNTGLFCAGRNESFVLHHVTPHVPLRLRMLGDEVQAEVSVTAEPGVNTQVVLRPLPVARRQTR